MKFRQSLSLEEDMTDWIGLYPNAISRWSRDSWRSVSPSVRHCLLKQSWLVRWDSLQTPLFLEEEVVDWLEFCLDAIVSWRRDGGLDGIVSGIARKWNTHSFSELFILDSLNATNYISLQTIYFCNILSEMVMISWWWQVKVLSKECYNALNVTQPTYLVVYGCVFLVIVCMPSCVDFICSMRFIRWSSFYNQRWNHLLYGQ